MQRLGYLVAAILRYLECLYAPRNNSRAIRGIIHQFAYILFGDIGPYS